MKSMIAALTIILLAACAATGQDGALGLEAPPAILPIEEPPTPSGTPEPQASPVLLPGSNQLPAQPPFVGPLQPPNPKGNASDSGVTAEDSRETAEIKKPLSPEEQARNKKRLAEIKEIAMRNSRAITLLKEANGALTDEAKREFMRAYYHTLCTRMRDLDPGLSRTISEFEQAEIRKLASGPSHLPIFADAGTHKEHRRHGRHETSE
jgi:hypothetical protein